MNFRHGCRGFPLCLRPAGGSRYLCQQRLFFTTFLRKVQSIGARASVNGGSNSSNGSSQGKSFFVPGATMATIFMLGALHARRLYDDKKLEEVRYNGMDLEFKSDVKATFLRFLPLRPISRCWGFCTRLELPVWLRPHVYQAWARAFHSNLEESALPLEEYASLRDFFVRKLKEGSRPINPDPHSLVSPVDGVVLRFGELRTGAMIEQVKGYSYSAYSLLGSKLFLPSTASETTDKGNVFNETHQKEDTQRSWLTVSLASPKVRDHEPESPTTGLFYCVLYLNPGDYHRIHSPADWSIFIRRHFPGRLFPMNERASRTIRNLYVENERVVLEGKWKGGYMAMAAVGATNIGSVEVFIEPALRTNQTLKQFLHMEPPEEKTYGTESTGMKLTKGDEVGAFNLGSTVILVFQALVPDSSNNTDLSSEFNFSVKRGDKIRMGQELGGWH